MSPANDGPKRGDRFDELLDLAFDCHEDPRALLEEIAGDETLQAQWHEAQELAGTLLAASFDAPSEQERRVGDDAPEPAAPRPVPARRDSWLRALAIAAALLIALPAAYWGVRAWSLAQEERRSIDLVLAGPRNVPAYADVFFTATTRDLKGKAVDTDLEWELRAESGELHASGRARTAGGEAKLRVAAREIRDSVKSATCALHVRTVEPGARVREVKLPVVIGDAPPLVHMSLDKPVYRPGELLRGRAAVLDRASLAPPPEKQWLYVAWISPTGAKQGRAMSVRKDGVLPLARKFEPNAAEGNWHIEIRDRTRTMLLARHKLSVLRFQAPKLAKTITLDRETYAPGQSGSAELRVTRNGVGDDARLPVGASVEAMLVLDGETVWREGGKLDASGSARFGFEVPDRVQLGAARFVAKVTDGAIVETEIEAFLVPLGRLAVAFFPESGTLAAGVESRVYVEVRNARGRPVSASGRVVDAGGNTITSFRTEHQGRGRFRITAERDARYELVIDDDKTSRHKTQRFALPVATSDAKVTLEAVGEGFAAGAPARFRVTTRDDGPWLLGVFSRGSLVGQVSFRQASGTEFAVELPPRAAGVLRATVFDARMRPVAERLVRRASLRRLDVAIAPQHTSLPPGSKQSVNVSVRDEAGKPVQAVLGVSVYDKALRDLVGEHPIGIEDDVWLCADVEELEDVEDFVVAGPSADRNIDLLLGTRGWRRFAWAKPTSIAKLRETYGIKAERLRAQEARPLKPALAQSIDRLYAMRSSARHARDYAKMGAVLALVLALFAGIPLLLTRRYAWRGRVAGLAGGLLSFALLGVWMNSQLGGRFAPTEDAAAGGVWLADSARPAPPQTAAPTTGAGALRGSEMAGRDDTLLRESGVWMRGLSAVNTNGFDQGIFGSRGRSADRSGFRFTEYGRSSGNSIQADPAEPMDDFDLGRGIGASYYIFYAQPFTYRAPPSKTRDDSAASTVYFHPHLKSDASGSASFSFDVSHKVTTWVIHVDGHGARRVGQAEARFDSRLPLELELQMPTAATHGDVLEVPISVQVDMDLMRKDDVVLGLPARFSPSTIEVVAKANAKLGLARTRCELRASGQRRGSYAGMLRLGVPETADAGAHPIEVVAKLRGNFEDAVQRTLVVRPRGFPVARQDSGVLEDEHRIRVSLPETMRGKTLSAELRALPSPLATILDGLQGMLREPHGCFEQVSSTTYPNVLALQLLENVDSETRPVAPAVLRDARAKIARGYTKLAGYECSGGGFEWWGKTPASLGLTAYGLLEFVDMASVHAVDAALIDRTRAWLLARRDGGGFRAPSGGKRFGRAPASLVDAYVTWSLLRAGTSPQELAQQIDAIAKGLAKTADAYELALRALVLTRAKRGDDAARARAALAARQRDDGSLEGVHTLTRSGGRDRLVETTALAILAWVGHAEFQSHTEKAMRFLRSQRRGAGSFGGTQATVLALQAVSAYAQLHAHATKAGELRVFVGDERVAALAFSAHRWRPIELRGLEDALRAGENEVRLELTGGNRFPFTFAWSYRDEKPASASRARVELRTKLARDVVARGETVALELQLRNRSAEDVTNPIAVLGIPAGLEAPKAVLDALVNEGSIAQWERHERFLVLYWYGIRTQAALDLRIDLLARTPGQSEGQASRAYLYYDAEDKAWAPPLRVRVR